MTNSQTTSKELLSQLANAKKYRILLKHCGKKTGQVWRSLSGEKPLVVQYYPAFSLTDVEREARAIYKEVFGISEIKQDIRFVANERLLGGMQVFYGDMMLDHSFLRVATTLSKDL